ncbi:hypothetical protein B5807_06525 [Epicoccum nigrum]|uniref:PARP catalytic domain-containing protein n=1 Tax=Epicoccum nigrum TaxID=105696 RepID=A0A1Y2LXW8_EPING|nr:hypothetical protein B5807_06525 [Epicoccum nigrum]
MHIIESRMKRRVPLKHSVLFNKAKHSEDWHQAIDAIAGVLPPSDSKFPYPLLRQATEDYLKKKGKITQNDADIRLAILIESHTARDIAVAAAAHAMTAGSLRAILHVNLNVSHGSYWGLETWLQCLIAANYNNPASVTDLEARWAHCLLPFATHGPAAAGKVLIGISRALRECATPNMNIVPDFLTLTSRAVADYGAHLEGLRLKNNWTSAYAASCWMAELSRTLPASTPPGFLLPEHILDTQFPIWRVWARWRPDLKVIQLLSSIDGNTTGLLSDLLRLEGPDFINGEKTTLREGLIDQYTPGCSFIKLGHVLIEVLDHTRDGLGKILESVMSTLVSICTATAPVYRHRLFSFFAEVTVNQPLTQEALNLVQAILFMVGGLSTNTSPIFTDNVLRVYTQRTELGGRFIHELQDLIRLFDHERAFSLRKILLTPDVLEGITRCIQESQAAVCMLLKDNQPWTELALELHAFCTVLKQSETVPIVGHKVMEQTCLLLPSEENMKMAVDIYSAARCQDSKSPDLSLDTSRSIEHGTSVIFRDQTKRIPNPLEEVVEQYISHGLLSLQAPSFASQRTFSALLKIWEGKFDREITQSRRLLAISVANVTDDNIDLRIRCLNGIASTEEQLGPGLYVQDLLEALQDKARSTEDRIVELIRLLARCSTVNDFKAQLLCWRDLAYHLLAPMTELGVLKCVDLIDHTSKTMNTVEWLSFLTDVQSVFVAGPALPPEDNAIPSILRPELQRHRGELMRYTKTLTRLESSLGIGSGAMRFILSRGSGRSDSILSILQTLQYAEQEPVESFLHDIVGLLSTQAKDAWEFADCVSILHKASSETVEICKKIWDAKHGFLMIPGLPGYDHGQSLIPSFGGQSTNVAVKKPVTLSTHKISAPANPTAVKCSVPEAVVEVMVAGWLLDKEADELTRSAVYSIANLLNIVRKGFGISKKPLLEAAVFWQKIEDEIIQEAKRLQIVQKALKSKDPKGTSLILQELGVSDTSELDEEIAKLPVGIMDMVERIDDHEVGITFSLSAISQLQRSAMGIPDDASTLMLQLLLDKNMDSPPAFCLHYDTDQHFETMAHARYSCSAKSESPTKQICTSTQTALTWQLSRFIYSKLCSGVIGIADIYQQVTAWIPGLAKSCVSCSTSHSSQSIQLRRSTPCEAFACARLWYDLPLHVRIPEVRSDPFAVDMALSSVYAAATANKPELLPSCPIRGFETIKSILNSLPTMRVMRDAVNLSSVLSSYHPQAEQLISWAVVHHRGFLATATGLLKIPNLAPGTHQFVLTNASPKLEATFVQKIQWTKRETTVLFHGTALDRLPAILAQGLRVCSGTTLQRTGAAHGKGIYLSDDPATSFYYSPASLSWKNSGLSNMRMLLGCDVVGSGNKVSGNIHVISDADIVMVRYVLLFTKDARMPIRGHVEPAMASGMKVLRSGAV